MQRRQFIQTSSIALSTSPWLGNAWAQGSMPHNMAAMPGMAGMHSGAAAATALAPVEAMAAGAPLAELKKLVNTSRQPGVFRATLRAAPVSLAVMKDGTPTEFWAYNNSLPGPLIEVMEGDTVEIEFINALPQPSTIHWHGLPVPPAQDGNPQDAVPAGGRRVYRFKLPLNCAGTYWYHPHPHGFTAEQVYRGLAGLFIVRTKNDPLKGIPERHLVCSDLKLGADGHIAANDMNDEMNGREGQFALVNAQRQPVLTFDAGGRERWRIWNANSARYLRLSLPGATFTLVGTDGGLLAKPVTGLTELLMTAAERMEVIVEAPMGGGKVGLVTAPVERGKMGEVPPESPITLLDVDFSAVQPERLAALPKLPGTLRRIQPLGAVKAKKRVVFSEEMSMAGGVHSMKFLVNGQNFNMQRVDFTSRINEVELWEIANESDMDHPFHIHGVQFQVVERELDGQVTPEPLLAWRDMVNTRSGEIVRVKLVQRHKGLRMFHCHILEHENAGMMGQVNVI
ncbi:multicopper oxidase family protein [Rhodoferax sp.]|uniref:multicopper oxidase family protein n=1 Tax=Rhodoferax sp. TaxID=50421 RepID=UPI00262AB925|nr:multicopper oxidase family protein [Rhodoferax sp.]MDD2810533.1 multicopper oxidase family protein [Rhodoferax sp.]MDD4943910.1 multicopper oxidase family protein [Rhodoferax sp.]